uniref:Uncharacterized protein n=1 Tax=Podoviridae sp. ctnCN2 TaxID=2825274 RepID=A0A8S5PM90_9CAUD|nr:MAG TPA: hypothetical protein [Podoviridae sp. ctnCN2]
MYLVGNVFVDAPAIFTAASAVLFGCYLFCPQSPTAARYVSFCVLASLRVM